MATTRAGRGGTRRRSPGGADDDFDRAPLARQQAIMRVAARNALAAHDLHPTSTSLLRFEDNAVYRVRCPEGDDLVLRVSAAGGHTHAQQLSEVAWLDDVAARRSVAVPRVRRTGAGEGVIRVEDGLGRLRECVLFEWIAGRADPARLGPATARRAGTAVGHLHQASLTFRPPPDFERPEWTAATLLGPAAPWRTAPAGRLDQRSRRLLEDVAGRVDDTLGALSAELRTRRLVHADLHRGNVVVRPDEVALIDFDDCGFGPFALDLATFISSLRLTTPDDRRFRAKARTFLDAYSREVSPPDDLVAGLPVHLVLRDMVIVGFVLTSANPTVLTWGPARVAGILRHLEAFVATGGYPGDLR